MICSIYELKCRTLTHSGHTEHYHWRLRRLWFWQSPLKWVNEQVDAMGDRVVLDSLRKVS